MHALALLLVLPAAAAALESADWSFLPTSYAVSADAPCGADAAEPCGPADWHTLDGADACADAGTQSPVNLAAAAPSAALGPLQIGAAGNCTAARVFANAHAWEVEPHCDEPSTLTWDGVEYTLKQFHVHSTAEHAFGSGLYDAELHLVHWTGAPDYKFLVVGVLLSQMPHGNNTFLDKFWSQVPEYESEEVFEFDSVAPMSDFLPASPAYVTYEGSFTTPPCTTGVRWVVMEEPVPVSDELVLSYRANMLEVPVLQVDAWGNTNRPLQELGGREVEYYGGWPSSSSSSSSGDDDDVLSYVAVAASGLALLVAAAPLLARSCQGGGRLLGVRTEMTKL